MAVLAQRERAFRLKEILIVIRSFDHLLGGMETHTSLVAKFLSARGYRVTVLTPELRPGSEPVIDCQGLNIVRVGRTPPALTKYSISYWRRVNRYLRDNGSKYEVIINSGMSLAGLLRRPTSLNEVLVLTVFHGTYRNERRSLISQLRYNPRNLKAYLGIPYCFVFSWLQRRVCRLSDKIVAVSPGVAKSLLGEYRVPSSKLYLIENFIDTERFTFRQRTFTARPMKIVFLSRLHPAKGIFVMLDALRLCIKEDSLDVVCDVYGSGSELESVRMYVEKYELSQVVAHGPVRRELVPDALNTGDFFVFPTLLQEAQPLALLEAMSSGLVCIVANVPGTNTLVKARVSGYLFSVGSVDGLRAAINVAYRSKNNVAYSKRARQAVDENHSQIKQLGKLLELIQGGREP